MKKSTFDVIFVDFNNCLSVDRESYPYHRHRVSLPAENLRALADLQAAGVKIAIVTNQRGLAIGKFTLSEFVTFWTWVLDTASKQGVNLKKLTTLICPHDKNQCTCRKPQTGLIDQFINMHGEFQKALMFGDKPDDVDLALNWNKANQNPIIPIQVQNPNANEKFEVHPKAFYVAKSLAEAINWASTDGIEVIQNF